MIQAPHQTPLAALPDGIAPDTLAAARRTAQEFESVFLNTLLAEMFSGLSTDGPFGGGPAEETYRSLLVEEYAGQMAAAGGIGLADHVLRDIVALQEMTSNDH